MPTGNGLHATSHQRAHKLEAACSLPSHANEWQHRRQRQTAQETQYIIIIIQPRRAQLWHSPSHPVESLCHGAYAATKRGASLNAWAAATTAIITYSLLLAPACFGLRARLGAVKQLRR